MDRKKGAAARAAPRNAAEATARILFLIFAIDKLPRSALQRLIDDGEPLIALLERHAGNTEQRAQLVVRDLHRTGRGRSTGRRLRERGRARGVERHIALDLLHHLVDVAVEYRDRAEALEQFERTA